MGFSILADTEKPSGQGPKEPAVGGPAGVEGTSPDVLQRSLPS